MREVVVIGENIHASRSVKTDGPRVRGNAIVYEGGSLPVPDSIRRGAEWAAGRVRPCAVAMELGLQARDAGAAEAARNYIGWLARSQVDAGACFLDVNVDAFSSDVSARCAAMRWIAEIAQAVARVPLSVDSSQPEVLEAGLQACDPGRGAPLLNSVSLERPAAIGLAARHKACVVASAAGDRDVPPTAEGRLENLARLTALLAEAGISGARLYFDPLVLPVAVDSTQPGVTLATIRELRHLHGDRVHITGGFSNVSFGLPHRRLLNEVFTWLAIDAGADSGIMDPMLSGPARLAALDPASEPFRLARAALSGEDEYAMAFLSAAREGRLGSASVAGRAPPVGKVEA